MLFDGALYSYAQLMKALYGNIPQVVPSIESMLGRTITVSVAKVRDTYAMGDDPQATVIYKNEVKGFRAGPDNSDKSSAGDLP
jgi:hypothetical protein